MYARFLNFVDIPTYLPTPTHMDTKTNYLTPCCACARGVITASYKLIEFQAGLAIGLAWWVGTNETTTKPLGSYTQKTVGVAIPDSLPHRVKHSPTSVHTI